MDRLERYREQRKQERIEKRREARQAERAAVEESTPVVVSEPEGAGTPRNGALPGLLLTIRSYESGGNYSAYNGSGCEGYGCFGAYQLHGAYMDDWARRYGAGGWASVPANRWPPAVQDKVALGLFYSTNPDGAHWCAWVSYC
jgi:hypothetical protein